MIQSDYFTHTSSNDINDGLKYSYQNGTKKGDKKSEEIKEE